MAASSTSPFILRGALVSILPSDPNPSVFAFQYNPETLQRSVQPRLIGGEDNDRSEAIRFAGAPTQTINVEALIDATDNLSSNDAQARRLGVLPQLSAMELLVYPSLDSITRNASQLSKGMLEIAPLQAPRLLFVWGAKRVMPVRLQSIEVTEEIFDNALRPIRASVKLSMRVLNYSDLDSGTKEYFDFAAYQQNLVNMAGSGGSIRQPDTVIGNRTNSM